MMSSVITMRLNRRRAFSNDSPSCSRTSAILVTPPISFNYGYLELTPFVRRSNEWPNNRWSGNRNTLTRNGHRRRFRRHLHHLLSYGRLPLRPLPRRVLGVGRHQHRICACRIAPAGSPALRQSSFLDRLPTINAVNTGLINRLLSMTKQPDERSTVPEFGPLAWLVQEARPRTAAGIMPLHSPLSRRCEYEQW